MESRRTLTVVVVSLLIATGAYGFYYFYFSTSDWPAKNTLKKKPDDNNSVEHSLAGFKLIENFGPYKQWTLSAPSATRQSNRVELESPRVVYIENGDTLGIVTAHRGTYDVTEQQLKLKGKVKVKRIRKNQFLTTNFLQWNRNRGTLSTEAKVRLETSRGIFTARGLWADLKEEELKLKSDVKFQAR